MVLTKRQQMLLATFFLGLIGLVVDRVFLRPQGGADTASAEAAEQYAIPASSRQAIPAVPAAAQGPSLAERLHRLWPGEPNSQDLRDPFSLPVSWFDEIGGGSAATSDTVAAFAANHTLEAVVVDHRQTYALVGDRFLAPGQEIDGFTLVRISPRSAVFRHGGEQITLELAK
jgi:hypothetical protein